MKRTKRRILPLIALLIASTFALAQGTKITAPKNRYSPTDDVKIGREAAAQVSRELPLLPENGDIDAYVERVGSTLAAAIPNDFVHPEFRYEFSVVNARDINAFALPGGPMFVNRGMIEAARSEGEMAGVIAHEISHVALRHGTAQATKSQSAGVQLGAIAGAILGAVIGGNAGDIVAQGTQLGVGAYLLQYSREYETQADILGSQILARAGYDPMNLATMFETIESQGGGSGPEWLSSHPNPGNRRARIAQEAKQLRIAQRGRNSQSAEFAATQAALKRMSPAPTMEEIARERTTENGSRYPDNARIEGRVEPPSSRYRTFEANRLFRVFVPENWREFGDGTSVTFAPDGAYGTYRGQSVFTHGAIVGIADVRSNDLNAVSDQYLAGILNGNNYLRVEGNYQQRRIGGRAALRRRLSGNSAITNRREIVDVYTTFIGNGRLFYIVQVVPANEERQYKNAFEQMVASVAF
jgi:hypothetical protein